MRIVCPGYRDPLEELFRDESAAVTKRAQRIYRASGSSKRDQKIEKTRDHSPPYSDEASGALDPEQSVLSGVPGSSLSQPIEHVAFAHFMSTYIPGTHFVYLPKLYSLEREDTALPTTVHAVSLARLAWELGRPDLMQQARRAYTKALAETNVALSRPCVATSDAVLVSVLLLSLYESLVWADTGIPDNWTKHTRGALALIQLRGKQQLETEVGRQMFTQVANIICVDSMRSGSRLSPDLLELQTAALEYRNECPRYILSSITGEISTFLAELREGRLTPLDVIAATQQLEEKLIAMVSSLPASWQYDEEEAEATQSEAYGKLTHRYPSRGAAQLWNSYRMTRIFLNGIRHGHARYLRFPNKNSLLKQAAYNAQQMAADICASVPQYAESKQSSIGSASNLLWPLSTVRSADLVGEDLRMYAEEKLKLLGRELRIPQVEKISECREIDALHDGLHMFYLT
jgi:hypothetical protein